MDRSVLKPLRWLAPGVLFYLLTLPVISLLPVEASVKVGLDYELFHLPIAAIVFSLFYNVLNVRYYSNASFHREVTTNIESRLWQTAHPNTARPVAWTDKLARDLFYHLVDKDPSLTARSQNIYFNGFVWTTIADARAVSLLVLFMTLGMLLSSPSNSTALTGAGLNLLVFCLSFPGSYLVTKKHIQLGNEQLDYIVAHYSNEVRDFVTRQGL